MSERTPSPKELFAAIRKTARELRDKELGPDAIPPFSLSDVKRRARRAAPFQLLILAAWVASILGVILLVRPLMVARSDWYGLLVVAYLFPSVWAAIFGTMTGNRLVGLRCPYCGTTFEYFDPRFSGRDAEASRRCGHCQAILIDLSA